MKWLTTFGRFWYDFIVGDSVVLALGGCATIAASALVVWLGFASAAQFLLPMLVAVTLIMSLRFPPNA